MVFEPVVRRIGRAVAGSSVEVGGKLLGRISNRRGRTVIQVETFIDSGPRADTSAGHLFPDGEYQERVYRVVQSFDPEISHLGSWHSHHANGLLRLSVGDVRGYLDSVNDDRYGLDHFLALLVKGIGGGVPYLSYYLFGRASNDFVEVGEGDIAVIGRHHPAEELLRGVEGLPAGEVDACPGGPLTGPSGGSWRAPAGPSAVAACGRQSVAARTGVEQLTRDQRCSEPERGLAVGLAGRRERDLPVYPSLDRAGVWGRRSCHRGPSGGYAFGAKAGRPRQSPVPRHRRHPRSLERSCTDPGVKPQAREAVVDYSPDELMPGVPLDQVRENTGFAPQATGIRRRFVSPDRAHSTQAPYVSRARS